MLRWLRCIEATDLVGKTISSVDVSAVTSVYLKFTDDTSLELAAEIAIVTSSGSIPGFFVVDSSDKVSE